MNKFVFSVLRDNGTVKKQSDQYPVISIPPENAQLVPDRFDGRDSWNLYIRPPSNTKTLSSVAIVAKDVLNDRFTLLSGGQIGFDLDHFQILACKDKAPVVSQDGASATFLAAGGGKEGFNIFDGWEYIYSRGLPQLSCFSLAQLKALNYPTEEDMSYEQKVKAYGFQCSMLNGQEDTQCLEKWNNIPIAKRLFLSSSIYNITSPDMSMVKKIAAIKYDLVKWGPLAAGFLVYENFLTYDGKTTYSKVEGKAVGGHYVTIIGWKDDYWICRNNFGAEWGLLGYFRMKMGILETELEDNVSACLPLFYENQPSLANGKWRNDSVNIEDMAKFNPDLHAKRIKLAVNYLLMYSQATIQGIQLGKLHGELKPLIANTNLLPNLTKFWVMDIQNFNFATVGGQEGKPLISYLNTNVIDYVLGWTLAIVGIAIFVWIYNKK